MKWTVPSFVLLLVCSVPVYAFYSFTDWAFVFGNFAQIAGLIFAILSYLRLIPFFERNHPFRSLWGYLALGTFIWLLGQILEIYCELVLNLIAYGTVADALWVVGYFPIIYAFHRIVLHRLQEEQLESRKIFQPLYIVSAIAYILMFAFLILPQLRQPDQPFGQTFLDFFYPTFDFILIVQSILLLKITKRNGPFFQFSIFSAIGFILTLIGDAILSLVTDFNSVFYLSIDVYYFACYYFMAIAADRETMYRLGRSTGSIV